MCSKAIYYILISVPAFAAFQAMTAAGVVLLLLVNVALFIGGKSDWHDPALLAGSLVGGLLVQSVLVAVVYGLYRLVRRNPPRMSFLMVAFRTLAILAALKIATMALPEGRNGKIRDTPPRSARP